MQKILQGPEASLYRGIVHAFYKRCGLPYLQQFANKNEHLLEFCKPTIAQLDERSHWKYPTLLDNQIHEGIFDLVLAS